MEVDPYSHRHGVGWLLYAIFILTFAGLMNLVYGISALANSAFFVNDARFVFGNLHTWAWILIAFGVLQLLAAVSVFNGGEFGRWAGMVIAGLNVLVQFGSIQSYPFWAILIIAFDVLVIYGLAMYGGHSKESGKADN